MLSLPTGAAAVVDTTSVTTPADPTHRTMTNSTPAVTVSGEAVDATNGDLVDLWCVTGTTEDGVLQQDVTITAQAFSTSVPGNAFPEGTCRLLAVPDGTDAGTADLSGYSGPLVTNEVRREYTTPADAEGSPNVLDDFAFGHQQARGYFDFYSISSCGICGARLYYDDTKESSEYIFWFNGFLRLDEDPPFNRAGAQVDGHNAWGSVVSDLSIGGGDTGQDLEGVPPLAFAATGGGPGEDLTVDEAEDLVRCDNGDPYPVTRAACGRFVPTGVRVERRILTTRDGTLLTFTDVFRSTDGREHLLDLRWTEGFKEDDSSFQFPWLGDAYAVYSAGSTVAAAPPGSPIFTRTRSTAADGDRQWAQGAFVFDTAIGPIQFAESDDLRVPTQLTVPAGGSATMRQAYAMAATRAELAAIMAPIENAYGPPTVTITGPAEGATLTTSPVDVTGTARDNKGVAGLTVNGTEVAVAADDGWSTRVALSEGENTISAVGRDTAGNEVTATRRVVYAPPPPPPPPLDSTPPAISGVGLTNTRFAVAAGPTAVVAAAKRGTRVRYSLSEAATVTFAITRARPGRRSGGRCRRPARRLRGRPRCTRYVRAGRALRRSSPAGRSTLRFTGRIGRRALRRGRHRMAVVATDAAGNRSRPRRLVFRVVRR